jgi:hypothetical protein
MINSSDFVCLDEDKFRNIIDKFFSVNEILMVANSEMSEVFELLSNKSSDFSEILKSIKLIMDKNNTIINNINYGLNSYKKIEDESILELEMFDNNL